MGKNRATAGCIRRITVGVPLAGNLHLDQGKMPDAEARICETGQWFFWRELRAVAREIGADDPGMLETANGIQAGTSGRGLGRDCATPLRGATGRGQGSLSEGDITVVGGVLAPMRCIGVAVVLVAASPDEMESRNAREGNHRRDDRQRSFSCTYWRIFRPSLPPHGGLDCAVLHPGSFLRL
ncbi:MAG: hypothetical protein KGZ83_21920 [Sulfuricella sp.]|nr:hypothetical protein [Sulfuricella sp.]